MCNLRQMLVLGQTLEDSGLEQAPPLEEARVSTLELESLRLSEALARGPTSEVAVQEQALVLLKEVTLKALGNLV